MDRHDMDGLTRRGFLRAACGTGALALSAAHTITFEQAAAAAVAAPQQPGTPILVIVTLYGGNDALNTVIPASRSEYQQLRQELAYRESEVLPLGDDLGLNPAMTALHRRWRDGTVAIVRGVGFPASTRSHFASMDAWQSGNPTEPITTGWIGRWLDTQAADPLLALNIGNALPPMFVGSRTAGSSMPLSGLRPPAGPALTGFRTVSTGRHGAALRTRATAAMADLLDVAAATSAAVARPTPLSQEQDVAQADGDTTGGGGQLAAQLALVARCIAAGLPTRVYSASLGGFDTHASEKATQSLLLGRLSTALDGFLTSLQSSGRAADVTVLVYSEFGRRVAANLSQGTDHGTASSLFIVGSQVQGGFYGEQPDLRTLVNGDLAVTTDFRDVYAGLLVDVLDSDPGSVLHGWSGTLPVLRSAG